MARYNKTTCKYESKESCERDLDKNDEYEEYLFIYRRRFSMLFIICRALYEC